METFGRTYSECLCVSLRPHDPGGDARTFRVLDLNMSAAEPGFYLFIL